jgi:hypothetical protein
VKTSIAGGILACALLSLQANAQPAPFHGGGNVGAPLHNGGGPGPGFSTNFGGWHTGPFVGSGFGHELFGNHHRGRSGGFGSQGFPGFFPWGYGGGYVGGYLGTGLLGDYGYDNEVSQPPQPAFMAQPQLPPSPPPPPARSVIREYNWPAGPPSAGMFSLVLKDGTVHTAIAVWVQDGVVHYNGRDGSAERIPLDRIDRDATNRSNAQGQLTLRLPAR